MCPHTDLTVMEFFSLTSRLSNTSTPCLLIKLLCCGPEVAATFREERIGSVLEPLMTFLTGLTVVSIETTSVAPEGDQEMVG